MSGESILTGLLDGECVDPRGDVQLLVELSCLGEDICRDLQAALRALPCRVEWQAKESFFQSYVLGDHGADQDQLLLVLSRFLDGQPGQLRIIESRLVQRSRGGTARHGFRFVASDPQGPQDIVLATGNHAFGSGNHPSTSLVVELLEELPEIPATVLDVGCGTGVLSIIAGRLGAQRVVGVDIDEEAVLVAIENARANNLTDRLSFTTSQLHEVDGPFALILANLTASVLCRLMDSITSKAGPGTQLIISGLQGRQGDEAEEMAAQHGWHLEERRALGKWQVRLFGREV
ncbi:MAG: 50S ribosomal protein L11 methyltransferase [Proteobacteria bacterium]|nr:50S ribosomal protein L11 methyltransferase [Pseudomonadota bacterium]